MDSSNLTHVVPKFEKVWHTALIEMLWNKANRNFWTARWIGMKVCMYQVFMKAFYKIQRSLIFRCLWYQHQNFKWFHFDEDFPKLT